MKKILIFSFVLILLIGSVQASALSALWKQGISAANPQAAKFISAADKIMEIQSLAQCATGLGAALCAEQIITQKAMGQVYGEAIKAAGPEVQKIISTYQQLDLYKQAGAEIMGVKINEQGEIESGTIQFSGEKESEIGNFIGGDFDVSVKGDVELSKQNGRTILTFKGGSVNINGKEFKNIQAQDKAGHPTYLEFNEEGALMRADFTTNENGGVFNLGEGEFEVLGNSRVQYNRENGEPLSVKFADNSELKQINYINPNFKGKISYEGTNFKIGDDEISGKVTVFNGKIIKVWKETDATIRGINHRTISQRFRNGKDLNIYYDENFDVAKHTSENYFNYGKDIHLGGEGFTSEILENNDYGISLTPESEEEGIVKQLNMKRNLVFNPTKGHIKIEKVSVGGGGLSLAIRGEGNFFMENGNYYLDFYKDNIYVDGKKANILQDNIKIATDMRLEYLSNNKIKTYDINTGESITKDISLEGIDIKKKEVNDLNDLKKILKNRETKNLNEDQDLNWNKVYDYVDLQIKERETEIQYGREVINPVFGQVISSKSENVKISNSNFFGSPVIKKEDMQYFAGADKYTGAAFIIAAKSDKYDPAFGVAAQLSGEELAEKGYYVLKMEGVVSEYPQFMNMLENPNLHKLGKDLKINNVEIYSHSWSGGLWLEHYGGAIHSESVEMELEDLGKVDLYYKYLSKGGLRDIDFKNLNDEQIKFIRNNLAPDAEISYKGCNVGNFPSMAATTHDILKVKVEASPVGTYMQKFDPKHGEWTAFELDDKGDIIYSNKQLRYYNYNQKKFISEEVRVPKEKIFKKGDVVRMHPNVDLLKKDYIQENLPDITGFLTIIDSKTVNGDKYYKLEYPTKKGINTIWVDEYGNFQPYL